MLDALNPYTMIRRAKRILLKLKGKNARPIIIGETDDERDKKQRDLEDDDRDYKKKDEEPYDDSENRDDDEDENETPSERKARARRMEAIHNYARINNMDVDEAAEELDIKTHNPFKKNVKKEPAPTQVPKSKIESMKREIYEAGGTPQVVSTIDELRKVQGRVGALQNERRAVNMAQETAYGSGGAWAVRDYEQNPKRLTDDELRFAIIHMEQRQATLPDWQARQAFGMDVIGKFKKEVGQARWEMEYQRAHKAAWNANQNPVTLKKQNHKVTILEQQAAIEARTGKKMPESEYKGYR